MHGEDHNTIFQSYKKALLQELISDAIDESGALNQFSGAVFNKKIEQYKQMPPTSFFARSSEKLNRWFKNTKLYQDNLADFMAGRGMTMKAKIRIMVAVTLLMSVGCILMGMSGIITGCVVLGCVWMFHILYFIFGIKTIPATEAISA